jgi:GNAT superfamily N-acetyltransferase
VLVRELVERDIPMADDLRDEAGWNQLPSDWERLLAWGPGLCLGAEADGRLIATTTATPLGPDAAWVGMVLVHPAMRRRGIARLLLTEVVRRLEIRGITRIGLDATPEGRPLYESMAFRAVAALTRHEGTAAALAPTALSVVVRTYEADDAAAVSTLDREAFAVERTRIVEGLLGDTESVALVAEEGRGLVGYACARPGARRWYLGPIVCQRVEVLRALLDAVASRLTGRDIAVDTFDSDVAMRILLDELGLRSVRPLTRMVRGIAWPTRPGRYRAIAGPEIG